jgi:hypothetical protein
VLTAAERACDSQLKLPRRRAVHALLGARILVNGPLRTPSDSTRRSASSDPAFAPTPPSAALRLLMIDIGGGRPGEMPVSTFGHPERHTYGIDARGGSWARQHLHRRRLVAPGPRPAENLRFEQSPPDADAMVPKFPSSEEIHVVVARGTAGAFSTADRGSWSSGRIAVPASDL